MSAPADRTAARGTASLAARARARLAPVSLRAKAVLYVTPAIALVSLVYTAETIRAERRTLRDQLIERGETVASIAARTSELAVLSGSTAQLERAAQPLLELADVAFVSLSSRSGPLLHRGGPDPGAPPGAGPIDGPLRVHVAEHRDVFAFTAPVFSIRAADDLGLFEEVAAGPRREHVGWVRIGLSKAVLARSEARIRARGMLLGAGFTAAGALVVYVLVSLALQPLAALLAAVQELGGGEYREVKLRAAGSEVGGLLSEFNRMGRAVRDRELRLTASEKKLQDLFARVEHALFRVGADGRIALANRKFEELCGSAGRFDELVKGQGGRRLLERAAAEGPLRAVDAILAGRDGRDLEVALSVYPERDASGALVGFDGYFVDVTERNKLEAALVQSQKMESVGQLAGGVAHDFNNILTAIQGCAHLVRDRMREGDPSLEDVDEILSATERATHVTRGLLAFSRRQVMSARPENLNAVVTGLDRFLRRVIGEDVEFRTVLAPEPLVVLADAGQLQQVLMNLATNARDAMPGGGALSVRTARVVVDGAMSGALLQPGPYALLSVSDTGAGMDRATAARIFEPFFTTKPVGKGTGLGLAIVYGIVKQHGGHVTVYSEPGEGTTFHVYLRIVDTAAPGDRPGPSSQARGGTETVLVAEDDPGVRRYVRTLLESHGYTVIEACDGAEAAGAFERERDRIDLLVIDVIMPRLNGREVYEQIRRSAGDRPVLFVSGYAADVVTGKGLLEPGMRFVSKPVSPGELLRTIRELLDR